MKPSPSTPLESAHLQLSTIDLGTASAASGPTKTPRVPDHEVLGGELFPPVHGFACNLRRIALAVGVPTPNNRTSLHSHRCEGRRQLVHVTEGRLQLLLSRLLLLRLPHLLSALRSETESRKKKS